MYKSNSNYIFPIFPSFTPSSVLLSFPFFSFFLLSSPSTLLFSTVDTGSRALRQTTRTATSVPGSPRAPPLLLLLLPLTHARPRLTPPFTWGKGRYSCTIVIMRGCFKSPGSFCNRDTIFRSLWGPRLLDELLSRILTENTKGNQEAYGGFPSIFLKSPCYQFYTTDGFTALC